MLEILTSILVALINIPVILLGAIVVPFIMIVNSYLSRWTNLSLTSRDVVLVTGCDSGIGLATVRRLLDNHDCKIIATLVDDKGPIAVKLRKEGVQVIHLDYLQPATIGKCAKIVCDMLRLKGCRLHSIVNNAGLCVIGELDWMTPEQVHKLMDINATGPVLLVRALMDRIVQDKSRLVFVTSIAGYATWPYFSVYSMSKAAIEQFVRCLRMELAPREIPVIVVRPGNFTSATDIMAKQDTYGKEMWSAMDERKKQRHDEFWHIIRMIRQVQQMTSRKDVGPVVTRLEETLVARYPRSVIEIAGWRVRMIQLISYIAPTSWVYPVFYHAVTAYLTVTKIIFGDNNEPVPTQL